MRGRRLCVGGPKDGEYVEVRGQELQVALSPEQWFPASTFREWNDPRATVPFRTAIYRAKKIAFGTDGAHTEIEVMAYYGTSSDERR